MGGSGASGGGSGQVAREVPDALRRAFDHLPDPVLLLDGELVVRHASQALRALLGWAPDEVRGRSLTDLVVPEDVPTVLGITAEHLSRGVGITGLEVRARHRDGGIRTLEVSGRDLREDPGIASIVVTLRDITRSVSRSEEIVRARDFYLTLLDRFPSPVWRSTTRLGVDWVNRAYVGFTGRTVEEELGEGWAETVHPEDLSRIEEVFSRTFERQEPFVLEYRLRHRSGAYRWVVDHGQPILGLEGEFLGHIGTFYDVHDRRLTEAVLRATIEELRTDLGSLARVAEERREAIARFIEGEERRARELADQIENDQLQALAAVKLRVELLGEQLSEDPVASTLDPVMRSVEETMRRLRRLMHELRDQQEAGSP